MALNLATMVHESARSNGDKPALLHDAGRLTYRELDTLSDRFAAGLQARAIGRATGSLCSCRTSPSSSSPTWGS